MLGKRITVLLILGILIFSIRAEASTNKVNQDSLEVLNEKVESIQYDLNSIKRDRQNYKIERDLLKNTYSSNIERINIFITIFLGIFAILGFLGIRDINKIKEKYESELEKLRNLKENFEVKSKEFENEKEKFNQEIKELIEENEQQSRRIKLIELKEKIATNLEKDSLYRALEYCNAALEFDAEDTEVLLNKGRILCRQNELEGSINTFIKVRDIEPDNNSAIFNIAEAYLFNNQIDKAKEIISNHEELFNQKSKGDLLEVFKAIEFYHKENKDELLEIVENLVDYSNLKSNRRQITGWDLREALYFIAHQDDDDYKVILQNLLWYLDGHISGEQLLSRVGLPVPEKSDNNE